MVRNQALDRIDGLAKKVDSLMKENVRVVLFCSAARCSLAPRRPTHSGDRALLQCFSVSAHVASSLFLAFLFYLYYSVRYCLLFPSCGTGAPLLCKRRPGNMAASAILQMLALMIAAILCAHAERAAAENERAKPFALRV